MKAVQVSRAGGPFETVERDIPEPGPRQVRVKVEACGVCHSDVVVKEGFFGVSYPRVPGHEIAGRIDAVGRDVALWKPGQRVGVGWHGGHCFECDACRSGDFIVCKNEKITALHFDGGYEEYMIAPAEAVAALPEGLSAEEAAPLMCAGMTVFNALRNSGARAGDLVAVQGIGGLGHLAVQFADKMGFDTIAIGRGKDKEAFARQMGARHYVDSTQKDWPAAIRQLGGAHVALATAPDAKSIAELLGTLGPNGKIVMVAAPAEPLILNATAMIFPKHTFAAWSSGTAKDSEDTLRFAIRSGVRAMIETFPFTDAAKAYDRMMTGKVRFRAVLTTK
jgi:D-arabinose 1-dehydrogenase-like Zn-dependent alcohol dehydrogenase